MYVFPIDAANRVTARAGTKTIHAPEGEHCFADPKKLARLIAKWPGRRHAVSPECSAYSDPDHLVHLRRRSVAIGRSSRHRPITGCRFTSMKTLMRG